MNSRNAFKRSTELVSRCCHPLYAVGRRGVHTDGRNRLTNFWTPTQRKASENGETDNGNELLIRAGFVRQAHSGIFHLLPLGLRVQDKIERLIDKHMRHLGASKVSLSSISSEDLWRRSGRLDKGRSSELLQFEDRRGSKYLLSPTHEEEITVAVRDGAHSFRDLPLRLYQVSRKYRDEPRPRGGLLRGREFVMKDLYTFDVSDESARQTYEDVKKAYVAFFDEIKLPYMVATASSGNMGGSMSHEFHFASPMGEDMIITCDRCDFAINEELYMKPYNPSTSRLESLNTPTSVGVTYFVSKDRRTLRSFHYIKIWGDVNIHAIKAIFPEADTALRDEDALNAFDKKCQDPHSVMAYVEQAVLDHAECAVNVPMEVARLDGQPVLFTTASDGLACPQCHTGKTRLRRAVEIGHTFHLGTRYSDPLDAKVLDGDNKQVSISMGCHGIGVSRLIGAAASLLADHQGLNWPLVISPFEVIIMTAGKVEPLEAEVMYDRLEGIDAALDDRDKPLGWKLNDADLIGYPFVVILGNDWRNKGLVELQCRRLEVKEKIAAPELLKRIREYSRML